MSDPSSTPGTPRLPFDVRVFMYPGNGGTGVHVRIEGIPGKAWGTISTFCSTTWGAKRWLRRQLRKLALAEKVTAS